MFKLIEENFIVLHNIFSIFINMTIAVIQSLVNKQMIKKALEPGTH